MTMLITVVLAFTLCLSACGGNKPASTEGQTNASAQSTQAPAQQSTNVEPSTAPESDYPKMAITINTSKAGSNVDTIARVIAKHASTHTGVNVIVNSTSGQVDAARQTIMAEPDGYTLCSINNTVVINDVMGSTDFHSLDDMTILGSVCINTSAWIAITRETADKIGVTTFEELVQYSKTHPGELSICNQSANTTYVSVSQLISAGLDVTPVDVGDASTRITNLLGGNVDIYIGAYSYIDQYIQEGKVVCLANAGANRSIFTPDIPCTYELGYEAGCPVRYYLCGPKGLPEDVISYWNDMCKELVEDKAFVDDLAAISIEADYMDYETINKFLKDSREEMIAIGMGTGYSK